MRLLSTRTGMRAPQNAFPRVSELARTYHHRGKQFRKLLANAPPKERNLLLLFFFISLGSFAAFFLTRPTPLPIHTFRIATASADIVPKERVFLSGFASRHAPPASTALLTPAAPLRLRVLAAHFPHNDAPHGTSRLVLISFDLIGIERALSDAIFETLFRKYGLQRRDVRLVFSHTHSGPAVGKNLAALVPDSETERAKIKRYADTLIKAVTDAVGDAISSDEAKLVRAYFATGSVDIAVNRRQIEERLFQSDGVRGDTDPSLPVLWFRAIESNDIVAGVYGFAAHATVLTTTNQYSGDYPGAVSAALEAEHIGSTWLFLPGCGGDLNIYPRGGIPQLLKHRNALVQEIDRVMNEENANTAPISGLATSLHAWARLRLRTTYSIPLLRKIVRLDAESTSGRTAAALIKTLKVGQRTNATYDRYPMSVWTVGELKMVFLGGEPTVDYAKRIRNEAGAAWVVGYSDDVMGYVGTAEILTEGKREGSDRAAQYYGLPCAWEKSVESHILQNINAMCQQK